MNKFKYDETKDNLLNLLFSVSNFLILLLYYLKPFDQLLNPIIKNFD